MDIYLQSIDYGYSQDVENLISDLEKLEDIFGKLRQEESNNIFWIDNKRKIVLNTCSKYVCEQIKEVLFNDKDSIKILTSATLNTSNKDEQLYEYYTKFFVSNQCFSSLFIKIVYKFKDLFLSILDNKK